MNISPETLPSIIEELSSSKSGEDRDFDEKVFDLFISLLDSGDIRAAEKVGAKWEVHAWVKKGILLGFKLGALRKVPASSPFSFFDKHTYPTKEFSVENNVRIVPGGTSVRRGAYLAPGVIMMPPSYVNVGAYVGKGTMIDSHALIGSCAQIGERIHISAAAQIGGVLEPVNALPVIIEDDVMIGGNCGIYEGTIVKKGAVIGAGVILTSSMPVYDCVNKVVIRKSDSESLAIPENAVVVAGSRGITTDFGRANSLSLYTPLIVKYRDSRTDARTALEDALR